MSLQGLIVVASSTTRGLSHSPLTQQKLEMSHTFMVTTFSMYPLLENRAHCVFMEILTCLYFFIYLLESRSPFPSFHQPVCLFLRSRERRTFTTLLIRSTPLSRSPVHRVSSPRRNYIPLHHGGFRRAISV